MVMEHLEGQTLAERLDQTGTLPWPMACLIAEQVADALGAAHDKGIIHRDLKPENVFLVGDGRDPDAAAVKVLDFGVAKLRAVDALARLTRGGALVGTPEYMSPEQCGASEAIDHRADIYGLGCVLFEMLSGQPPFVTSNCRGAHRRPQVPPSPVTQRQLPGRAGMAGGPGGANVVEGTGSAAALHARGLGGAPRKTARAVLCFPRPSQRQR